MHERSRLDGRQASHIMQAIEWIASDVQRALRSIARMRVQAAVVIVSLGVGIGVNTAVFSWIEAVVLRPLPGVADPTAFHLVEPRTETGSYPGVSWLEYRDLEQRLHSFRDLLAFRMVPFNVGQRDQPERTYGLLVSGNYFSGLGVRPVAGRFFGADEIARAPANPVVVISYDFWQSHFAGALTAPGQTIRLNDRPLTIIGVTPRAFQGTTIGLRFDLWVPATLAPALLGGSRELEDRGSRGYAAIGRLQPGVTSTGARAELDAAMRELAHDYPATNRNVASELLPFWSAPRGPQRFLVGALALLQVMMLLLLLAACGNTANLVLARSSVRQREIGIRLAVGASRWRIMSLLLTEAFILGLLGAAVSVPIAMWGTDALRGIPQYGGLPIKFQTRVDAIGLAFAVVLAVGCGVIAGIVPAVQSARIDPLAALRSGVKTAGRSPLRNAVMAAQVAIALIVLLGAGLFLESFQEAHTADTGFRRDGVLLAAYDLSGRNVDAAALRSFARTMLDRIRAIPGVEAAAIATSVPLDIHGLPIRSFSAEGHARADGTLDRALANTVSRGYFDVMGIPLLAGHDFVDLDDIATPPQAIVNEEFSRRYIGASEPIGRRVETGGRRYTIAAVARNSLSDAFGEPPTAVIYLSYRDRPSSLGQLHVRTRAGGESSLARDVRGAVREVDPSLPLYDVRTMNEHIETNLIFRRVPARMFVVLGPLLLLLAATGIYAVAAYTVSQRTTEIGVRIALGATGTRVAAQLARDTMRSICLGALGGWALTLIVTMDLLRTRPISVAVFAGIPIALLLVSAAACWIPARRASRLDPLVALRYDA